MIPETFDPTLDDAWRDQCLLYLFGELDADQSDEFVRQLESSPELGCELARQAELIEGLAAPPVLQSNLDPTKISVESPVRWLSFAVLAMAASIIFAMFMMLPNQSNHVASQVVPVEPSEELLIARVWVSNQHEGVLKSEFADMVDTDLGSESLPDVDSDLDSTLAWMVIAVSTSPDSQNADLDFDAGQTRMGATNDG